VCCAAGRGTTTADMPVLHSAAIAILTTGTTNMWGFGVPARLDFGLPAPVKPPSTGTINGKVMAVLDLSGHGVQTTLDCCARDATRQCPCASGFPQPRQNLARAPFSLSQRGQRMVRSLKRSNSEPILI